MRNEITFWYTVKHTFLTWPSEPIFTSKFGVSLQNFNHRFMHKLYFIFFLMGELNQEYLILNVVIMIDRGFKIMSQLLWWNAFKCTWCL